MQQTQNYHEWTKETRHEPERVKHRKDLGKKRDKYSQHNRPILKKKVSISIEKMLYAAIQDDCDKRKIPISNAINEILLHHYNYDDYYLARLFKIKQKELELVRHMVEMRQVENEGE